MCVLQSGKRFLELLFATAGVRSSKAFATMVRSSPDVPEFIMSEKGTGVANIDAPIKGCPMLLVASNDAAGGA